MQPSDMVEHTVQSKRASAWWPDGAPMLGWWPDGTPMQSLRRYVTQMGALTAWWPDGAPTADWAM
jgi:hypothetical protein